MSEITLAGDKSLFLLDNTLVFNAAVLFTVIFGVLKTYRYKLKKKLSNLASTSEISTTEEDEKIEPVDDDFSWETAIPLEYVPFKNGPYRMTMAIRKCPKEEWLLVENTYLAVTNERKRVMEKYPQNTILFHESCTPVIQEFYDKTVSFLLSRYHTVFHNNEEKSMMYNSPRRESIPVSHKGLDPNDMLRLLSTTIEEDFLLLTRESEDQEYVLRGGSWCFPSGFDPLKKFNQDLTSIHAPVPRYDEKLKLSMNRFLGRLKPNEYIVRENWAVQIHSELCSIHNNHSYSSEEVLESLDPNELDFDNIYVRSERQVLTKLPKTKAVVFTIRTYLFPMSKLRNDDLGETLCGAIDGLPEDMAVYKRREEWGEAVKAYMRYETDGKSG